MPSSDNLSLSTTAAPYTSLPNPLTTSSLMVEEEKGKETPLSFPLPSLEEGFKMVGEGNRGEEDFQGMG